MKKIFFVLLFLIFPTNTLACGNKLKVITTFSILADFAKNVGGDKVEVTSLVGMDGDAHVYEPSPRDIKKVAEADVIITNGLGFEGWLARITKQAEFSGIVVVAASGVETIGAKNDGHEHHQHDNNVLDPHAWHDISNAIIYVKNIEKGFSSADREHKKYYAEQSQKYINELKELDKKIKADFKKITPEKRKIVTSHDAFSYYAKAYGFEFLSPQGVSTESEASAKDVAALIRLIKTEGVKALFVENIADPRLVKQISEEGGAIMGGKLYSDALSQNGASTYIEMMKINSQRILQALE